MMLPSYNEIQEYCKLVDYNYKLTGKTGLWIETYEDVDYVYQVIFRDDDQNFLPTTITQQLKHDTTS